jgi:hypothetical protein
VITAYLVRCRHRLQLGICASWPLLKDHDITVGRQPVVTDMPDAVEPQALARRRLVEAVGVPDERRGWI